MNSVRDRLQIVASELNQVNAGWASDAWNKVKNFGSSSWGKAKGYGSKAKSHIMNNKGKYGAATAAAVAAAIAARHMRKKAQLQAAQEAYENQINSSETPYMNYFNSISAADYLSSVNPSVGYDISAADYSDMMNITAMEYLISVNNITAELEELSDAVKSEVLEAQNPLEFRKALEDNSDVTQAHADVADAYAEKAAENGEDSDEAAALAEYHAQKAAEHADIEDEVMASNYYGVSAAEELYDPRQGMGKRMALMGGIGGGLAGTMTGLGAATGAGLGKLGMAGAGLAGGLVGTGVGAGLGYLSGRKRGADLYDQARMGFKAPQNLF